MHCEALAMRAIGNLLWVVLGGFFMGLAWWMVGIIAFLTIIGIPWGKACFVIGQFTFIPFGREAISRKELNNKSDIGTGTVASKSYFVDWNKLVTDNVCAVFASI